jgi:hypothetical protein
MEGEISVFGIVFNLVLYVISLIPAFVVSTYIVGRERDKPISVRLILIGIISLLPFLTILGRQLGG